MPTHAQLETWDKKHSWHPFTQMRDWIKNPILIIDRANGSYLVDTRGRKYLDGVSSLWCNVHGHRVKEIDQALKAQAAKVSHSTYLGLAHTPGSVLTKKLIDIAPKGLTRVFYSDSGSEAVEVALKIAFQYWQHKGIKTKTKFLRFKNAYHGDTMGSVSVGGIDLFHRLFKPMLFTSFAVNAPNRYRDGFEGNDREYLAHCLGRVERVLKVHARNLAAIILEPLIQGAAGMITQPRGFVSGVRKLADRYEVLLILDEVATGFGRTGRMFACEHEKVSPDILCLAKGLTGGYLPMAATLATEKIHRAFMGRVDEFKTFFHGHTYTANPLAAACAIASIDLFRKNRTLAHVRRLSRVLEEELSKLKAIPQVGDIRQAGLMAGIELVENRVTRKPFLFKEQIGHRVTLEARKRGLIIRPLGNVLVLMPSFSFSESEIRRLVRITAQSIQTVMKNRA